MEKFTSGNIKTTTDSLQSSNTCISSEKYAEILNSEKSLPAVSGNDYRKSIHREFVQFLHGNNFRFHHLMAAWPISRTALAISLQRFFDRQKHADVRGKAIIITGPPPELVKRRPDSWPKKAPA
jgi:hypothetical protein